MKDHILPPDRFVDLERVQKIPFDKVEPGIVEVLIEPLSPAGREVVQYCDIVLPDKGVNQMRADESRPSGHED